jgi:MFS family permease
MLQLGGTVKDVAIAIFLSNLAMMIGSFFWGKLSDVTHWRRAMVLLSLAGMFSVGASILLLGPDIPFLLLFSALVGFFSIGSAVTLNTLVMERSKSESWVRLLSSSSLLSSSGAVISMLAGYSWLIYSGDTRSLAFASAVFAGISLAMASFLLRGTKLEKVAEGARHNILQNLSRKLNVFATATLRHALLRMIASSCQYSLRYKAKSSDVTNDEKKKSYKTIGEKMKEMKALLTVPSLLLLQQKADTQNKEKGFLLLIGATLFFYISAAMIFGPYTPFLKENGITDAEVFIATAVLHLSKIALLPFNNQFVNRIGGEIKASLWSYWPRLVGIGMVVGAAILLSGNSAFLLVASVVSFVALQIGFTIWHAATNSLLFGRVMTISKIDGPEASDNKGKMLGISSSVTGGGALVGSLCVGEFVAKFGYGTTFGISGIFLLISFLLISRYRVKQAAIGNSIEQLDQNRIIKDAAARRVTLRTDNSSFMTASSSANPCSKEL